MKFIDKVRSINNFKYVLIGFGLILISLVGFKVIELIRDTGIVENKDRTIGQLKIIKQTQENANKDLQKKIIEIKKTNEKNIKAIVRTNKKDKEVTVKYKKIKKNIVKKIAQVKKKAKRIPKNISVKPIKVDPYIYKESGKVIINGIWDTYKDIKDNK